MPHQCVHCGRIIDITSREILEGCTNCGGRFFYYIRDEQLEKIKQDSEIPLMELQKKEKEQIEQDVRNILNIQDEEHPIILDLESVKAIEPGKFEIDLVGLINKKPIVFKLEEGKYIIDLESGIPSKKRNL